MTAPKIAVVGSANTDLVVRAPRIPVAGETVLGGDFLIAGGGKGANQAVAAARLGAEVTLVARLGTDDFGGRALDACGREGIHTEFVVRDEHEPSGVALIVVDGAGENAIAVAPGANGRLSAADVDLAADAIGAADALLLQLEVPLEAVRRAAEIARAADVPVILNPAPARPLDPELLALVTVLTPNAGEAASLSGVRVEGPDSAREAALRLGALGVRDVVITLGADGALVAEGAAEATAGGAVEPEAWPVLESWRVDPVDTTAAGDAFNGGLAVALGRGEPLLEAARFASLAGALAATRAGAQPSLPGLEALERFRAGETP